jgi:hypothetical protein
MARMSEVVPRQITSELVMAAVHLATYRQPDLVEDREPVCEFSRLCGPTGCRFPRYQRAGEPTGLVAHVLLELGYPQDLLKALDTEYEVGEVLHPGVKIGRSRNAALARVDNPGMDLLVFLQERQKDGRSWAELGVLAIRPRRTLKSLDRGRRPWLY